MTTKHRAASGRASTKAGSRVKVQFGRRETTGVVTGKTVTGRFTVAVDVEGTDTPVTTTYARDELRSA